VTPTLYDMLLQSVSKGPESVAFIMKEDRITYRKLQQMVDICANSLKALDIHKGDRLGIVLRNSPEFVVTFFALAKLGAVTVPINFLETPDRLAYIFQDCHAKGCLTSREFLSNVQKAKKSLPHMKLLILTDADHHSLNSHPSEIHPFGDLLTKKEPTYNGQQSTEQSLDEHQADDDLCMLIYTSGTTGLPKGVMLTHKNFLSNVQSCREFMQMTSQDRFLCLLPMFHSFAWTTCVLLPLSLGSTTVIIESLKPFEPVLSAIWKQIEEACRRESGSPHHSKGKFRISPAIRQAGTIHNSQFVIR